MSTIHEEEALGKAYDSRLMKRLLQYMAPYKWGVVFALSLVAVVTPLELAPPWLFAKGIESREAYLGVIVIQPLGAWGRKA